MCSSEKLPNSYKDKPLVSLIVPVYNVEKYLNASIRSIEEQDYPNLEVIFVDDGSTDESGGICDSWSERHSNFRVIHQQNLGLSAARNNGVLKANGEYIAFMDSDDVIDREYISYLVKLIIDNNVDMSIARLMKTREQRAYEVNSVEKTMVLSPVEALEKMCYGYDFSVTAVAKLYKKELLLHNPYPEGKLYEDLATTHKIIDECSLIAYGTKIVYYYFQRPSSIMNSKMSKEQLIGLEAADKQLAFIEHKYPDISKAAKFHCIIKIMDYMNLLLQVNEDNKKWFSYLRDELRHYDDGLLNNRKVSLKSKIKFISIKAGYRPARLLFHAIKRM